MINWFGKYKITNFKGGYLLEDNTPISAKDFIKTDERFVAPPDIDHRSLCLPTSNQGSNPHCAGYSTAGYVEIYNWRTKHYPEQVDGSLIYNEAKKTDGNSGPGTYLKDATRAVITLGLMKGTPKNVVRSALDVKFAIHEYNACIVGFRITNEWNMVEKKTGIIVNLRDQAKPLGGHAVLLCGYNAFGVIIQNSWDITWGLNGFAYLSWEQFSKELMDAYVIVP